MEYTPQKESDIRSNMLLQPGVYDFEVAGATEKTSKAGNDMIEMQVRVFPGDDSSPRLLRDWLVAGSDLGELKINRFAHAVGVEDQYFAGQFSALSCEGAAGKCKVIVTSSAQYGDQNQIRDYVVPSMADEYAQAAAKEPHEGPLGVPASQTKRANQKAADVNQALQESGAYDPEIPF